MQIQEEEDDDDDEEEEETKQMWNIVDYNSTTSVQLEPSPVKPPLFLKFKHECEDEEVRRTSILTILPKFNITVTFFPPPFKFDVVLTLSPSESAKAPLYTRKLVFKLLQVTGGDKNEGQGNDEAIVANDNNNLFGWLLKLVAQWLAKLINICSGHKIPSIRQVC
ncbi:hypothetical protein Q3G72_026311 [Acer saccharum]|nr:hypothetical protein Q3G72_026311 [Acer saccharum]